MCPTLASGTNAMKKLKVSTGIIAALLASNVVIGYQYSTDIKEKDQEISQLVKQNKNLHSQVIDNGKLIKSQENEINTYKTEIGNINILINEQNVKITDLEKQVSEARERDKEIP